jgi:sulfoxide reductase catalytic subunit YedY
MSDEQITPPEMYFHRRTFMRGGLLAATAAGTALLYRKLNGVEIDAKEFPKLPDVKPSEYKVAGEELTPRTSIINYNNFYEFTTNKDGVAAAAANFKTDGWKIAVEGMCQKPRVFDLDAFKKLAPPEERVYRHRCVEAWSMVIPWVGFPLANLIKKCEPTSKAKYVEFTTFFDTKQMSARTSAIRYPYVEGLRMDEAMHPLTIMAVGLYGEVIPNQDGAPMRLVVPWKYGFKHIKSISRIKFVEKAPLNTWQDQAANEYGFYANVNPSVDHPRWSQATERRIGEFLRRKTVMFNGYGDQVASLYTGRVLGTRSTCCVVRPGVAQAFPPADAVDLKVCSTSHRNTR